MQTRVTRPDKFERAVLLCNVALGFCLFFIAFEIIEVVSSGLVAYFENMWNTMDWINFAIFFAVWMTLQVAFSPFLTSPYLG